jgi:hypothetical protein
VDRSAPQDSAARALLLSHPRSFAFIGYSTLVNSPDNDGPELLREIASQD